MILFSAEAALIRGEEKEKKPNSKKLHGNQDLTSPSCGYHYKKKYNRKKEKKVPLGTFFSNYFFF